MPHELFRLIITQDLLDKAGGQSGWGTGDETLDAVKRAEEKGLQGLAAAALKEEERRANELADARRKSLAGRAEATKDAAKQIVRRFSRSKPQEDPAEIARRKQLEEKAKQAAFQAKYQSVKEQREKKIGPGGQLTDSIGINVNTTLPRKYHDALTEVIHQAIVKKLFTDVIIPSAKTDEQWRFNWQEITIREPKEGEKKSPGSAQIFSQSKVVNPAHALIPTVHDPLANKIEDAVIGMLKSNGDRINFKDENTKRAVLDLIGVLEKYQRARFKSREGFEAQGSVLGPNIEALKMRLLPGITLAGNMRLELENGKAILTLPVAGSSETGKVEVTALHTAGGAMDLNAMLKQYDNDPEAIRANIDAVEFNYGKPKSSATLTKVSDNDWAIDSRLSSGARIIQYPPLSEQDVFNNNWGKPQIDFDADGNYYEILGANVDEKSHSATIEYIYEGDVTKEKIEGLSPSDLQTLEEVQQSLNKPLILAGHMCLQMKKGQPVLTLPVPGGGTRDYEMVENGVSVLEDSGEEVGVSPYDILSSDDNKIQDRIVAISFNKDGQETFLIRGEEGHWSINYTLASGDRIIQYPPDTKGAAMADFWHQPKIEFKGQEGKYYPITDVYELENDNYLIKYQDENGLHKKKTIENPYEQDATFLDETGDSLGKNDDEEAEERKPNPFDQFKA